MALSWQTLLAGVTAMVMGTVAGVPGVAWAESVSYACEYVSPVFHGPQGTFAFARGCAGPTGSHRNGSFTDSPPGAANFCSWVNAVQLSGREGLDVTGQSCL